MDVKCPLCDAITPLKNDFVGIATCHGCGCPLKRIGQPVEEIRQFFTKKIEEYESIGFRSVRWLTARDEHVCEICHDRAERAYTIEEAKEAVLKALCAADQFWQGCRCTIIVERKKRS